MDANVQWLLAALGAALVAAWLGYRAIRRATRAREIARDAAQAAARAGALRRASDDAARQTAAREAAARERAAVARVAADAAAETAARADAAHQAAAAQAAARAVADAEAHARHLAAQAGLQLEARRQTAARAQAEAARLAPPTEVAPPKAPDETLVMVADDSKVVRVKTGRLLAQHRYRVAYAIDGLDAARQMQACVPDVVITDVEMPGMDGFELTRHVRQDPRTAHIPIIMITAADDKHRDDAQRAGVTVLLGKPYPEDELIGHIRLAMEQTRSQRAS